MSKYQEKRNTKRVKVLDSQGKEVARVKYNEKLDYYINNRLGYKQLGYHRGLTRLRDGRLVLIEGRDTGERTARVVGPIEVLESVLVSGRVDAIAGDKYRDIQQMYNLYQRGKRGQKQTTSVKGGLYD